MSFTLGGCGRPVLLMSVLYLSRPSYSNHVRPVLILSVLLCLSCPSCARPRARGVWIPTRIYLHLVEPIVCERFPIESFGILCALTRSFDGGYGTNRGANLRSICYGPYISTS